MRLYHRLVLTNSAPILVIKNNFQNNLYYTTMKINAVGIKTIRNFTGLISAISNGIHLADKLVTEIPRDLFVRSFSYMETKE